MIFRFLAVLIFVGTTFAQTATPPVAATVEVWPEGRMPGKGGEGTRGGGAAEGWLSPHDQFQPAHVDVVSGGAESGLGGGAGDDRVSRRRVWLHGH